VASCRLDESGSDYGIGVGSCGYDNEISCSIRGGKFLEYLCDLT
jgi:hypothetical protein